MIKRGGNFNPRSHEGNDKGKRGLTLFLWHFNPRSHEGNDVVSVSPKSNMSYFNPRSHEGNDSTWKSAILSADIFQSTFPRGERPIFI